MRVLRLGLTALGTLFVAGIAVAIYVADQVTRVDRAPLTRSPRELSPSAESVSFRTSDGLTLQGWFVPASRERAAVIVHGKDSNRAASEHGMRLARWLLDAGYSLLLFDMRGHGESEGDRFSLGQYERHDVAAAVDLLVERGFAPGRIALVGESMGAGVAIQAVALRPEVGAVVADSPYADGPSIVDEAGPGETGLPDWYTRAVVLAAKVVFGLDARAVDPVAVVRRSPQVPFLFIHCESDALIHARHSRRLAEASENPATRLWVASGCGHVGASVTYPDEYRSLVLRWLEARLR